VRHDQGFSFVPDGSAIVYLAATPEDGSRLHLYTFADGVSRVLAGTEGALLPTVSPDGKWVAFFRKNRLMKVAVAGGPPIEVSAVPYLYGISWSPDDWIVFAAASGLARVPAAGGEPQTLTTVEAGEFRHNSPHVLPDGKAVLFTALSRSGTQEDAAICAVSVSTRERRTLLKNAGDARYSPTGHLLFVRQSDLLGVSFDVDRLRVSGTPFLAVESIHVKLQDLAGVFDLARDGTLVWVPSASHMRRIVWIDRKGVETTLPIPARPYSHPALMPDERSAIVEIEATPHNLWHLDLTSGALTSLTHESANHRPVLRQDGRFFAFSSDRTTPRSVFRQSTDGSGAPEQVANATSGQNVTSWSADGRWLALTQTTPETRGDIWVLPLDAGNTPRPFLRTKYLEDQATFSPDGRWIAYSSDETGRREVVIQSFPGDGPRQQVSTAGGETPAFSSDGRLFYRVKDQLWAAPIGTDPILTVGPRSLVFQLSGVRDFTGGPNYVISRRGDRVLAVKNLRDDELVRDIQVAVNWFESLRRSSGVLRESPEPAK
jgi:Tol biopolymer transport system component